MSDFFLRFQSYCFGNSGPHAKFQNRSLPPSGLILVSWRRRRRRRKNLLIIKASLASAEVSAGVVAMADQYGFVVWSVLFCPIKILRYAVAQVLALT